MEWFKGRSTAETKRLINELGDPLKRDPAAQRLVQLAPEAVPALINALSTQDDNVLEYLFKILIQIGRPAVSPLCTELSIGHPVIRGRTAEILGRLRDNAALPALLKALNGEFYTVRAKAAFALGQIQDTQAITALTLALRDSEPEVRAAASRGLGKFGDRPTLEAIGNVLLDDPQIEVRQAAAEALGETRRVEAIPFLIDALHDSFWWYEREQEINVLFDAIAKMGESVVPYLIEALKDPEGTVRKLAASLLARVPDERAIDPLTTSLYDTHFDVCRASAEALAAIGAPALQVLMEALHHPEAWIRQQAILGLTESHDPQIVPAILNLINDESREVRMQVVQSLGQLRDQRALPALEEFASSRADREIASLAKKAIENIHKK